MNIKLLFFTLFIIVSIASAQWVQTNGPYGGYVICFTMMNNNIFCGTHEGGVFISTNDGASWNKTGLQGIYVNSLAASGNNLFAGTQGGVFRSTDNGLTWNEVNTGITNRIILSVAISGNNIFAGATNGNIYLSTDNGNNWTSLSTGFPGNVQTLVVSGSDIYAGTGGYPGGVYISTDNGTTWTARNNGLTNTQVYSLAISGSNMIAGTYGGGVFSSTDNGANWTQVSNQLNDLNVLSVALSGTNIFAGTFTGLYLSTNNGGNWTKIDSNSIRSLLIFGTNILAGGDGIIRSTNNGANWSKSFTGLIATVVRAVTGSGQYLFAGTEGQGVFRSTDNGASWMEVNNGLNNVFLIYTIAADGTNIYAGLYNGLYVSTNLGENWNPTNIVDPVYSIVVSGSEIYVASQDIWRSTDNGSSWHQLSSNVSGSSIAILGNNIFVGTRNGYVYRSTDNGNTWTNARIGPSYMNLKVTGLAIIDTILFAGLEGAGVYRSTDKGQNWTEVNTGLTKKFVQSLIAYRNNLFVGTYQGNVFLSTNNGTNWTNVGDGLANGSRNYIYSLAIYGNNIYAGIMGSGVWRRPLSEITSVERTSTEIPTSYHLSQNYPNPFNPSTTISFSIPNSDFVTLKVYDVLGREVATLVNENLTAGSYSYNFDASNLTSGVYLYKLQAGKYNEMKKLVLTK
jgi:photosystem II stability/assembly factor-like uncharacterized protein